MPAYSFADGYLLSKTLDEMAQLDDPALEEISKLGKIHFKFGGNATLPCVAVDPEPKWPRPSILRRCVLDLDGRSRVRFDELPLEARKFAARSGGCARPLVRKLGQRRACAEAEAFHPARSRSPRIQDRLGDTDPQILPKSQEDARHQTGNASNRCTRA